ncbi:unnamed protein product [Brassicogethes aeneus]|uniref:Uncharacterized protein n=1 Tax=Brassicogethes aeneus TaxID=1431903 RepID=A0A9P0FKA1_BRAAE|nr:unnamed protein product [Brassicogethes aeneus]
MDLDYTVNLQKHQIAELTSKTVSKLSLNSQPTFSSIVKNVYKSSKQESAVLVVQANDKTLVSNDIIEIEKSINPSKLQIQINSTKQIKNGLVINCCNETTLNTLKTHLTEKVGDKFTGKEGTKFNPRFKIYKVHKSSAEETNFIQNLIVNNNLTCNLEDIKIIFKQENNTHVNTIIEVPPTIRKTFLYAGRVYIGGESYGVTDNYAITRCSNCLRYGHKKKRLQKYYNMPFLYRAT